MTTLAKLDTITLPRTDVLMDDDINSRMFVNQSEIERLAADIKARGVVMHPPIVMRRTQAGDRYEDNPEPFVLVVGFRRQKALDHLEVAETVYSIAPNDWTLADALAANLGENMAREDLTSYELAMACKRMKDEEDLSGEEVAKRIKAHDHDPEGERPLSGQHVNNLIRCTTLPESILTAWREGLAAATLRNMLALAKLETEAEQLAAWEKITNPNGATGDKDGGDKKGGKGNARRDRPTADACTLMVEAIMKADREDEWKEGAVAALKWAAGTAKGIDGVEFATPPAKAKKGGKGKKAKKGAKAAKGKGGTKKTSPKGNGASESPAASPA